MNYNDVLMHHYMSDDFLCHHGILGQKWGIRRFQNKDGSLTAAGKKRYLNSDGTLTKDGEKAYAKSGGNSKELQEAKDRSDSSKVRDKQILEDAGVKCEKLPGPYGDYNYYTKSLKIDGGECEINADRDTGESAEDFVKKMNSTVEFINNNNEKTKTYASYMYDDSGTDMWKSYHRNTEDVPVPSKEEFIKGLKLEYGDRNGDHGYSFYYRDTKDVFGGHIVIISVDKNGNYLEDELLG